MHPGRIVLPSQSVAQRGVVPLGAAVVVDGGPPPMPPATARATPPKEHS